MAYDVRNQQFRDATAQARHPFQSTATLTNGVIQLPDDFLLDAVIHLPAGLPPYHLASLRYYEPSATLRAGIADADGAERAYGYILNGQDHCHLLDPHGVASGALTHSTDAALRIGSLLGGAAVVFTSAQTGFACGVCFSAGASDGIVAYNIGGVDYGVGATLVARTGVLLSDSGGAVRIDLLGEEDFRVHVRSVNGVAPTDSHLWLHSRHMINHAPGGANVRTSNDQGTLRVARSSDFGYGDRATGAQR